MEKTPIWKLLVKLSPPVMLALLIQSVYNIVDSYFVAQYAQEGLTALSLIFPIQLLMTALATGTGTGLNILISQMDGAGLTNSQKDIVKSGLFLGGLNFLIFVCVGTICIEDFYTISSEQLSVRTQGVLYAKIVFGGSLGLFIESICTKLLQAKGNMFVPMLAQVVGAIINIILDPILIFGWFGIPELGIEGAALATVIGQWAAMMITLLEVLKRYTMDGKCHWQDCLQIYRRGIPSIVMQSLYTLYIVGLNLILKQFTEDAVTVLGIYYKFQTFFFIPLMGLQQVILPIISYNNGAKKEKRIEDTLKYSIIVSVCVMAIGTVVFIAIPQKLLSIFSVTPSVLEIGEHALRVISISFIPAGFAMMFTVYFQGINRGKESIKITIMRQVILLVPLAWLFHFAGLQYVWFTFPITEIIAVACCFILIKKKTVKIQ